MKILLVEDEDRSVRQTCASIARSAPDAQVTVATSRDSATDALERDSFDLVLCDLRIPPTDDSADVAEEHGLAVHAHARAVCPGTPLVFLTGFATPRNVRAQLSNGPTGFVYGIHDFALVQLVEKGDVEELEIVLCQIHDALVELSKSCAVQADHDSDAMFIRAIQSYAVQADMTAATVESAYGMSNSTIGRVTLSSETRGTASVFVKVLGYPAGVDEWSRYNRFVPNRLQPGYFAPAVEPLRFGLGKKIALISTLADGGCLSLFRVVAGDPEGGADVVRTLRSSLWTWASGGFDLEVELPALRRTRIADEKLVDHDVDEFLYASSRPSVKLRQSVCHGDLHGENVLVDRHDRPILIDFGDVNFGPAVVDPVTLELSILFHTLGPARGTDWARTVDWRLWPDVERFADGSPFEAFIHECRNWALERDSPEAICAFAYAHAMRQLKYPDVQMEIALGVARGSLAFLDSSS